MCALYCADAGPVERKVPPPNAPGPAFSHFGLRLLAPSGRCQPRTTAHITRANDGPPIFSAGLDGCLSRESTLESLDAGVSLVLSCT
jgi:hypothetical protein